MTRKWIREQARAVVMVVERSGVTKVVADLLRKSEFLNRLLYSADEPKGDPILLVAVVRVDDVADTRYQEDSAKFKKRTRLGKKGHSLGWFPCENARRVSRSPLRREVSHDLRYCRVESHHVQHSAVVWIGDAEAV